MNTFRRLARAVAVGLSLVLAVANALLWPAAAVAETDEGLPVIDVVAGAETYNSGTWGSINLATTSDHALWLWGDGAWSYYGIFDGSTSIEWSYGEYPIKVMDDVERVYTAGYDSMRSSDSSFWVIKTDGSLWAWGANGHGQLGDGTTEDSDVPVKVMDDVKELYNEYDGCTKGDSVFALKNDGTLWAWGDNSIGQLGTGDKVDVLQPTQILDSVAQLNYFGDGAYALKTDGSLWEWGASYGCFEPYEKSDGHTYYTNKDILVPTKVMDNVAQIPDTHETYAIDEDGALWVWGELAPIFQKSANWWSEVEWTDDVPVKVGEGIKQVTTKEIADDSEELYDVEDSATYVTKDGQLCRISRGYEWDGDSQEKKVVEEVLIDGGVERICWDYLVMADGTLMSDVSTGELISDGSGPISVAEVFQYASRGYFALSEDGVLWSWGDELVNAYGSLGNGTYEGSSQAVKILEGVEKVEENNNGSGTVFALKRDGTLWGWGVNYGYALGDGTYSGNGQLSPVRIVVGGENSVIPFRSSFEDVSCYTAHHDDIQWLYDNSISTGWLLADGTREFRGMSAVVRQDMAAFLCRLAGVDDSTYVPEDDRAFTDVDWSTPHCRAIWWLYDNGISTGWAESDGTRTFRGMDSVKRQDMAAFLCRLAGVDDSAYEPEDASAFSDVSESTPHWRAVMWLYDSGVSTGWVESDGARTFRGMSEVVRQDMAAFLHRMSEKGLVADKYKS